MNPNAALVMAGGVLLLGVDVIGVASKSRITRREPPPPATPAREHGTRLADPVKLRLADREQHPPRRRNRRNVPEQRRLTGQHREVRDAPSAVGDHHRQIAENPAGIVTGTPLPGARQRGAEPSPSPSRCATSASNAVPARDDKPLPSAPTSTVLTTHFRSPSR